MPSFIGFARKLLWDMHGIRKIREAKYALEPIFEIRDEYLLTTFLEASRVVAPEIKLRPIEKMKGATPGQIYYTLGVYIQQLSEYKEHRRESKMKLITLYYGLISAYSKAYYDEVGVLSMK